MKYALYGLLALAIGYFGVTAFLRLNRPADDPAPRSEEGIVVSKDQWEAKKDEQGQVAVTATPIELGKDAAEWQFEISLDTHSGSLDEDIASAALLLDGAGRTYSAKRWEGAAPGGHHREGVLSFSPIDPFPGRIELRLRNVGGIAERSFSWNLP